MEEVFRDSPIQIVTIKEGGDFELTVEGINFLSALKNKQVCILSITGPYRSGKSFLANLIMNRMSGFKTGSTTNSCTRGIWSWGRPIKLDDDRHLIVIDAEGLGSVDRDREMNIDLKIFTLTILMSTMVIYNTKHAISEDKIEELASVANLSKRINILKTQDSTQAKLAIKSSVQDLTLFFPKLIWVLRDFTLDIQDMTPSDYLEKCLKSIDDSIQGAEIKNINRDIIKNNFKQRECYTLVIPTNDEQKLRNLEMESKNTLRPEFMKQVELIIKHVKDTILPKKIGQVYLDGESLYGVIQNYVDSINNDENPVIMSALENVLLSKAKSVSEKVFGEFKKKFDKIGNTLPIDSDEILKEYFKLNDEIIPKFCESIHDNLSGKQFSDYITKMNSRMRDELEVCMENNNCLFEDLYKEAYEELSKNLEKNEVTKIEDTNNIIFNLTTDWYNSIANFLNVTKGETRKIDTFILKLLSEQIFQRIRLIGSQVTDVYLRQFKELNSQIEINKTNIKKYEELLSQERKANEERQREKSELFAAKIELESKYERLNREMNSKRKEYEEMLKTEAQKLLSLKSYYENLLSEKDKIAGKQEKKIETLNKKIAQLNTDISNKTLAYSKEITDKYVEIETLKGKEKGSKSESINEYKLNTLKAVFKSFQAIEMEFKDLIDRLDREKENVFKSKFFELSTKEIDSKSKNWLDELKNLNAAHIRSLSEDFESNMTKIKDELEEAHLNIARMQYRLDEETHLKNTFKKNYEDAKKQAADYAEISTNKDSIISKLKELAFVLEQKLTNLTHVKEDLEIKLNDYIINSRMKEDELETLLIVIEGLLTKRRDKYEHHISRLSVDNKSIIESLVKENKIFK